MGNIWAADKAVLYVSSVVQELLILFATFLISLLAYIDRIHKQK